MPDICLACSKVVYATEKLTTEGKIFHKACFRCATCKRVLKLGNYASLEGKLYCKPCFKKTFMAKGDYSRGFGTLKPQELFNMRKSGGEGPASPSTPVPRRTVGKTATLTQAQFARLLTLNALIPDHEAQKEHMDIIITAAAAAGLALPQGGEGDEDGDGLPEPEPTEEHLRPRSGSIADEETAPEPDAETSENKEPEPEPKDAEELEIKSGPNSDEAPLADDEAAAAAAAEEERQWKIKAGLI